MAEKKGAISRIQLSNASNGEYYVLRDEETRTKLQTDLQTLRTEISTKVESQRGIFKSTSDASGTSDTTNTAPLIVGNSADDHLEFDTNEIMAKSSKNTVGKLYINNDGGAVYLNGNPISGTLTKNTVWAAPNGANGQPTMRALVAADIPDLAASQITSGTLAAARGGTGKNNTSIAANTVFAGPNGSTGTATFRKLVAADIPTIPSSRIESLSVTKVSGLGDVKHNTPAAVDVASGAWKQLATLSLTAGSWLVLINVNYEGNNNGRRVITFGSDASQTAVGVTGLGSSSTAPAEGAATQQANLAFVSPTTTTTYYCRTYQNSGATLTTRAYLYAVRIK